jgi:tetratricopeptide (TPR) repeat protein
MSAAGRRYNPRLNEPPPIEPVSQTDRLESWKEIASYLNRSERTVRRWEDKEGLPIHRLQHDKRGSVYAFASELDAWRQSRTQLIAVEPADAVSPEIHAPDVEPERMARRWIPLSVAIVLLALAGGLFLVTRRPPGGARTPNPHALRAFKQAEFAFNAGRVQVQSGIQYYQEAIRLDPGYADAWNGLASAHFAQTWFSDLPARDTMALAKRDAERALALDPSLGGPWRVLAGVSHYYDWDHATAERQFRKALDLAPDSVGLSWFAEFLVNLRRLDEAIEYARRSQDASPRWLEPITVSGNVHTFTGHPDLAVTEYQRALAIEPNFGLANHFLGRAYLANGDGRRAVDQLRKSNELMGQLPFTLGDLGYALAVSGARSEAEQLLADLRGRRERAGYPAFPIAAIEMGLGHTDEALAWLERAIEERHLGYYLPSIDPIYDPVRVDPRFIALLGRMRIPPTDTGGISSRDPRALTP